MAERATEVLGTAEAVEAVEALATAELEAVLRARRVYGVTRAFTECATYPYWQPKVCTRRNGG